MEGSETNNYSGVVVMPRARNPDSMKAEQLYRSGMRLVDIAEKLGVPAGTVRRWKSTQDWEERVPKGKSERSEKKANVRKRGAPLKNQNAKGHGAPEHNQNAVKHGLFAKYLPGDSLDIIDEIDGKSHADILWENIQISYAAILRAQKIMYVSDKNEMIKEIKRLKKKKGDREDTEVEWEFQFAWDRQASFLTAQARAMSELRALIRQYEEVANEEQKARVEKIKAETERLKDSSGGSSEADDWVESVVGALSVNEDGDDHA